MPQLDPLLKAMVDRKASELVLSDGRQPVLRFETGPRPVSPKVLRWAQISALLAELSDSLDAAVLAQGKPAEFVYELEGSGQFRCEVGTGRSTGSIEAGARRPRASRTGRGGSRSPLAWSCRKALPRSIDTW